MIDQHEREVTGIDWSKPSAEPHKLSHRIPGWDEIPEEFREWGEPIAADWSAREGINEAEAKWHLEYISISWEYAVEHKRAALRWLHSLWFTDGVEPNEKCPCAYLKNGPLRVSYSRAEIADKLKDWMIELWGDSPKNLDPEQRDQWHRDNGLIYHFICDHFPENKEAHPPSFSEVGGSGRSA